MRSLVIALLLALATDVAAAGVPEQLVDEMVAGPSRPGRFGAMLLYAEAYAGYALVSAGLEGEARAASVRPRLDALIARIAAPKSSPWERIFHAGHVEVAGLRLSRSVVLRGHLSLLLAGRALLGELSPSQRALQRGLAASLAADILATDGLLQSYGGRTWPADNEVALAALALYARRHPDDAHVAAGRDRLAARLHSLERDHLPPSEVRLGSLAARDVPRGCALSWTVAMRGLHDPPSALALYQRYRREFWVDLVLVHGLREWPRGVDRPSDSDSGPIVAGIGVAASAFGMGAARLLSRHDDWLALRGSASTAGLDLLTSASGQGSWLPRAIAAWAEVARPW